MRRASVPSVPKKLDHNELGACESVPESVLASVPGSGPGGHETKGPRDHETTRGGGQETEKPPVDKNGH